MPPVGHDDRPTARAADREEALAARARADDERLRSMEASLTQLIDRKLEGRNVGTEGKPRFPRDRADIFFLSILALLVATWWWVWSLQPSAPRDPVPVQPEVKEATVPPPSTALDEDPPPPRPDVIEPLTLSGSSWRAEWEVHFRDHPDEVGRWLDDLLTRTAGQDISAKQAQRFGQLKANVGSGDPDILLRGLFHHVVLKSGWVEAVPGDDGTRMVNLVTEELPAEDVQALLESCKVEGARELVENAPPYSLDAQSAVVLAWFRRHPVEGASE